MLVCTTEQPFKLRN